MLQTRVPNLRDGDVDRPAPTSLEQTVSSARSLIGRRYPLLIVTLLLCLGVASVYLMTAPKRFSGTAVLLIDSRKMQGLQTQISASGDSSIDSSMVDSQVEVLKSEAIATAVIKDLHLLDYPEFNRPEGGLLQRITDIFSGLFPVSTPSDESVMRTAIDRISNNLTIKRSGTSFVIGISFQSPSREMAAKVANAIAENYIVDSLESKYQASRRAAVWLQDRLKELRAQASAAERTVADFKAKNNIIDAGGRLLTEQQLAEINSSLTIARAQRSEAQAKLERITSILNADESDSQVILTDLASVNDSMANPVINKLRQTYLDYAAKAADWSNRYGPTHLAVVNLRNQMREIRRSIIDELRRISEAYKSDLEIAKAREESSQKSLNETIAVSNDTGQAQILLRDLESNSQSARALSDNFLQLYMVSVQQQSFPITEARVLTQASALSSPKTSPKTVLVILAAFIGGSILAGIIGVFAEMLDRVFRTVSQVEQVLKTSCLASVPVANIQAHNSNLRIAATKPKWWSLRRRSANVSPSRVDSESDSVLSLSKRNTEGILSKVGPAERHLMPTEISVGRHVIDSPFSRFAEAVRAIKLATDLNYFASSNKVLGVTSALPNEGKSTISEALAQTLAQSGVRTLLIDGDIRNPSLTSRLAAKANLGLIDVILEKAAWQDIVWVDPKTNLHFLPCVIQARFSNSSDVLASPQMEALFQKLGQDYDRIVLDLSPLAPVVDVRATGALVDSFILVIEWAKGKIDIVDRVLNETPIVRERLLGAVLNKVDLATMSRYDTYSGGYYRNQYYKRYGYID